MSNFLKHPGVFVAALAGVAAISLFAQIAVQAIDHPDDAVFRPDTTPGPPPGYSAEVPDSFAPPIVTPNRECVDLRQQRGDWSSRANVATYVSNQRDVLADFSEEHDGIDVSAGVNFTRLLPPGELAEFLSRFEINWLNIYWEASNGVHGAISSYSSGDLTATEDSLKKSGDIGENDRIEGAYYVIVDSVSVKTLQTIQADERVRLVDIGRLEEFLDASAAGQCARFALPDPIWFAERAVQ